MLNFSPVTVYALKDMDLLSATLALHVSYHVAVVGLTRIFLPGFAFPLSVACKDVPLEFATQCQHRCRYHADEISRLISQAFQYAPEVFDDLICHMAAFEASKVQIVYTAVFEHTGTSREELRSMLEVNMRLMGITELDAKLLHVSLLIQMFSASTKLEINTNQRRTLFDFLKHLHLGAIARDLDEQLEIKSVHYTLHLPPPDSDRQAAFYLRPTRD